MAGPAAMAGALTSLLLGLGGLAQAILSVPVTPDVDLIAGMTVAALGMGLTLGVPVAALVGVLGGLRRLREDGAWLALRSLGLAPGALIAPATAFLAAGAVAWLVVTHAIEPESRAWMRRAAVDASARLTPVPGRHLAVGAWTVAVEGGALQFAGDAGIGSARTWSLDPAEAGVVARLGDVTLRSVDGASWARADSLDVPVALPGTGGRVHPSHRTTPALIAHLDRRPDPYERWILWKRTLLPACLVLLGLGAVPPALGRRPIVALALAQAFTLWSAIRLADQFIAPLGLVGATALTLATAAAWLGTWWRAH